jgi:hypothetical protein
MPISFDNSYARLPERLFAHASPLQSPSPALIQVNEQLASELGIDAEWLKNPTGLDMLFRRIDRKPCPRPSRYRRASQRASADPGINLHRPYAPCGIAEKPAAAWTAEQVAR